MKKIVVFLLVLGSLVGSVYAQGFPKQGILFRNSTGGIEEVSELKPLPSALTSTASLSFSIVNSTGILGTATLSIPTTSAVALPTAPTGATRCFVMPTQDVNWGATSVVTGTGQQYFFADIPSQGFFDYSSFTSFRLIGRTAVATATIIWR